jgi:hypothetical protein
MVESFIRASSIRGMIFPNISTKWTIIFTSPYLT